MAARLLALTELFTPGRAGQVQNRRRESALAPGALPAAAPGRLVMVAQAARFVHNEVCMGIGSPQRGAREII